MTSQNAPQWIAVGKLEDIPAPGGRVVRTPLGDIALFRTVDDQVYALKDQCPHRGGPLSQGMVHGHRVSCPLHGMQINLETGEAIAPDEGCASRYRVKLDKRTILLSLVEQTERQGAA